MMLLASLPGRSWSPDLKAGTTGSFHSVSLATPWKRTRRILEPPNSSLPQSPPPPPPSADPDSSRARKKVPPQVGISAGGEASASEAAGPESSYLARRRRGPTRPQGLEASRQRRPLWKRIFVSNKVRSIILLNLITVIYASNIPIVKEVEVIVDPALFTVVRFAVAAFPFIPFSLKACRDHKTLSAGIELGLWVSLGYLFQALGLLTSDAGRASFIAAFTVVVVPFMDGMFGAAIPAYTWSGAIVSLIGVALLECSGSPPCVGDILNFGSAVFFGIHMLRTEQISRSTGKEKFLALLGFEVCVVAFLSIIWFILRGNFPSTNHLIFDNWSMNLLWDWTVSFPWIPVLYTGIFSTGLCLWVELSAMRNVSATETAIIYGLEPVWGAAFAWFLLGERWGTLGWIGATLVISGSFTVQILGSLSDKLEDEHSNHK